MLIYWFLANFTIGTPSYLLALILEKNETGLMDLIFYYSSFLFKYTDSMSKEVTSLMSWSVFFTRKTKYYLQILHYSTPFNEHSHSQGYMNLSTLSLINGINPILWHNHSSCKTEVFSIMLTRWGANVGTYDINTLLRALARLTSQPDNENFIFSGLISKISIWSLSIAASYLMIQNIIKSSFEKIGKFYINLRHSFKSIAQYFKQKYFIIFFSYFFWRFLISFHSTFLVLFLYCNHYAVSESFP